MDYKVLADLLFPNVTDTPEMLEEKFPLRNCPEGAVITRMAPSPTGFVHLGNLVQGLISERMAHQSGGVLFLRVEDTDAKREVQDSLSKSGNDLTQASLNRLAALSQEILSYAPDLIGMQEDNIDMHNNLKLDGYIKAPNSFTTGEYCAIYYKDTMTLLASGGTWLTHTGNISSAALNYNDLTDPNSPYYKTPEELQVLEISKTADLVAKKTTYYDKTTKSAVPAPPTPFSPSARHPGRYLR